MKKPLILIQKQNKEYSYCRFIGKQVTNHVVSDRELFQYEVELFRVNPAWLLGDDESPSAA
jgi:hypothetical protein